MKKETKIEALKIISWCEEQTFPTNISINFKGSYNFAVHFFVDSFIGECVVGNTLEELQKDMAQKLRIKELNEKEQLRLLQEKYTKETLAL